MIIKETVIKKKQTGSVFLDLYGLGVEQNVFILNSLVTCFLQQKAYFLLLHPATTQSKMASSPNMATPGLDNKCRSHHKHSASHCVCNWQWCQLPHTWRATKATVRFIHFKVVYSGQENYKVMVSSWAPEDNSLSNEREIGPKLFCTTSNMDQVI